MAIGKQFGILAAFLLAACASSSVLPLSADTIQITTSAAPVCGAVGAQKTALRRAAIETINRGFDRFVTLGADAQNNVAVVGYTPMTATTYGTGTVNTFGNTATFQGSSTTTYGGGSPIVAGSHDQSLVVRMYVESNPAGANAIPARGVLGDNWEQLAKENALTCLDP